MRKTIVFILLCFVVVFAAFAVDMSPHPGDSIESVFIVQDVVVIGPAVSAPADVLYLESFNINSENVICMVDYDIAGTSFQLSALAVSYIGYEMGNDIYMQTGEVIPVYKTEFG